MGSVGFFIVYFAAGIFGCVPIPCLLSFISCRLTHSPSNVFGGNFSWVERPSVGASGAIFGTVAVSRYYWLTQLEYLLRHA